MILDPETGRKVAYTQPGDVNKVTVKNGQGEEREVTLESIAQEWVSETRWGAAWRSIFRDHETSQFYAMDWEDTAGDGEWDTFEDGYDIDLVQVWPQQITKTVWSTEPNE